jgi:hypothetical protein
MVSAAPSAPPESPAAGCTQTLSNLPSRSALPLATQLSRQHRRCSCLPSPRGRLRYANRLRRPRWRSGQR